MAMLGTIRAGSPGVVDLHCLGITDPTIRLATRVEQLSLLRVPGLRPDGALAGEQLWRASGRVSVVGGWRRGRDVPVSPSRAPGMQRRRPLRTRGWTAACRSPPGPGERCP